MQSSELQKHHIQSFDKLTISERLSLSFAQGQFLRRFMGIEARKLNKTLRRHGKKYFKLPRLA